VVTRLFNAVQPDVVVLGSKDYQQLQTIRYLVRDLAMPIGIVAAPTRREADGLAMSSRNQYLSAEERARAPLIHRTLQQMRQQVAQGMALAQVEFEALSALQAAGFQVDYIELRRSSDLRRPAADERRGLVALAAARIGTTRLIDNLEFED
jgi:pantoate--beta-alanine ligase